jgi:translation initiation factor IF-2
MAKKKEVKAKVKRLFKVAKEFNLSHKTLTEFLQKKGYGVSGPNDSITQEMYDIILERFAAEKKLADKLRERKRSTTQQEEETVSAEANTTEESKSEEVEEESPAEEMADAVTAEKKEVEEETAEKEQQEVQEEEAQPQTPEPKIEEPENDTGIPGVIRTIDLDENKSRKKAEEKPVEKPAVQEEKPTEVKEEIKEATTNVTETVIETKHEKDKKDKKKKYKGKHEKDVELSAKELKRKKALELIKREGKKKKPTVYEVDLIEEEEVVEEKPRKIGRPRKKKKKKKVDEQEVVDTLKKTLADLGSSARKKKKKKIVKAETGEEKQVLEVTEYMSVQELANAMEVPATEVIKQCMQLGLLVTINQRLDMDTIKLIADEFGFEVEEADVEQELLEEIEEEEAIDESKLVSRPPIVTVMGHVDHGKTSLLDYIRKANVVAGESGGITQHIGAYLVELADGRKITFLDTPGHEAFTAMRARGAQVTDIVVLVVAADDRVMPQTEEAIDHALAAGVSIVVAINKIDKPNANPDRIKKELAEKNILVEDWGGKYQCVEVSAKTGQNMEELLEKILLEAELMDLKANPERKAIGTIIESKLDRGKGPVATVLVQDGTLHVGDVFVAGAQWGKVRALLNERDQKIEDAPPSTPVQVLGFDGVPEAGDRFVVMDDERKVREIAVKRQQIRREQELRVSRKISLDEFSRKYLEGEMKELNVLIKADVAGSAQALADSLLKLNSNEVKINIVRSAVGPISESDVLLAAASNAILVGFHVRASGAAKKLAEKENVEIRLYKIIYDLVDDIKMAMEGMLSPIEREVVLGTAEVREVFKISKIGTVAGCYVTTGKIQRNNRVRLIRNEVEIYDGELASLKRFKDDVKEVASGYECGLMIKNYNDIKVGDIIEAYETVQEKRTLD